ncbi:putative glycoside hydrolase family 24 [Paratrimastix pyriformis]|uniref:Glycoside hydrolase family 24 n=1 Tax=Paratrimastix pyriformis TaxID=342808 RepID=A0ABQ8UDF7_9EUKA|nr:putative glycoside hydrolase family 24 [Paratrimastix pyriformis]
MESWGGESKPFEAFFFGVLQPTMRQPNTSTLSQGLCLPYPEFPRDNSSISLMESVKAMIKRHEGCRLKTYNDTTGHKTIGYGHKQIHNTIQTITQTQADAFFESDFQTAKSGAQGLVENWASLNSVRQGVLIDLVFNLGVAGVRNFRKMRAAIEDSDFSTAADEMLDSRWATQVQQDRVTDLTNMMRTGEE